METLKIGFRVAKNGEESETVFTVIDIRTIHSEKTKETNVEYQINDEHNNFEWVNSDSIKLLLPFTNEQLETFDKLTNMECSKNQMDRINARLMWSKWIKDNNLSVEQTNAMKEELVRQNKW